MDLVIVVPLLATLFAMVAVVANRIKKQGWPAVSKELRGSLVVAIGFAIIVGILTAGSLVVPGLFSWAGRQYRSYMLDRAEGDLGRRRAEFSARCLEERAIRGIHSDESCSAAALRVVR
jgi:hypothetical protein